MLERLVIAVFGPTRNHEGVPRPSPLSSQDIALLSAEFPHVALDLLSGHTEETASVDIACWRAPSFNLGLADEEVAAAAGAGAKSLRVMGRCPDIGGACLEVLSRYQRFFDRRNPSSNAALFDRILASHRDQFDLDEKKPRADYDHAVDTWQWLLRLDPNASLELQVAALFHDIEGVELQSDPTTNGHNGGNAGREGSPIRGPERSRHVLRETGLDESTRRSIGSLLHQYSSASAGPESRLLGEADALSFFSLSSACYLDDFGADHARKKIARTIGRLRPETRRHLVRVRFRHDVRALLAAELHRTELEAGATLHRIN